MLISKLNRLRINAPAVMLLAGTFFLVGGCTPASTAEQIAPSARVRPVKAIQMQPTSRQWTRTFPGTAKALQDTDLSFRVAGPLVALEAATGQRRVKGAVVARIDPRDFIVRVRTASANLAAAKAKLEEAERQFHRYAALIKEKASAKARYDQIKAAYEMASAQVVATAKLEENARNAQNDTTLRAPFTGYIHREYVDNHETVSIGQPIVSMVDLSRIEIEVPLPEDFLPKTNRFMSFSCRFDALADQKFSATFKAVAKQPNPASGTYSMTLVLDQTTGKTIPVVRPGMTAEVKISLSDEHPLPCFIVPVKSVVNDHTYQSFVWCIDREKDQVVRQPVRIEAITENGITINGNLFPGQWIVSAGAHYLTDHQRVRVLKPASRTNIGAEL